MLKRKLTAGTCALILCACFAPDPVFAQNGQTTQNGGMKDNKMSDSMKDDKMAGDKMSSRKNHKKWRKHKARKTMGNNKT